MVGNASYGKAFGKLKNPVRDAEAIVTSLENHGVAEKDIIKVINADSFFMREGFAKFVKLCKPGDLAILFFAGHGCSFNKHQCLMAIPLSKERRVLKNGGQLQTILESSLQVEKMLASLRLNGVTQHLVLLDCCQKFEKVDLRAGGPEDELNDVPHTPINVAPGPGTTIGYATAPRYNTSDGKMADNLQGPNGCGNDASDDAPYTSYCKC